MMKLLVAVVISAVLCREISFNEVADLMILREAQRALGIKDR
jgi:hypothetical protein